MQDRNTEFLTFMSDGDVVVVYAYPEVIKTPKFHNGRSVALHVIALQMNPKSCQPLLPQPNDQRVTLPPKRSFKDDPNDLRHMLSRHMSAEEPTDLRHVLAAKQNESAEDLRLVINDIRRQQSGVREVILSDVTSPTSSTAPLKQSSPLKGADAQLERDIYEVSLLLLELQCGVCHVNSGVTLHSVGCAVNGMCINFGVTGHFVAVCGLNELLLYLAIVINVSGEMIMRACLDSRRVCVFVLTAASLVVCSVL